MVTFRGAAILLLFFFIGAFTSASVAGVHGGPSWVKQNSGVTVRLNDIAVINSMSAIAVGDSGTILITRTGGAIWSKQVSGTYRTLNAIGAFQHSDYYAVGDSIWLHPFGYDWDVLDRIAGLTSIGSPNRIRWDDFFMGTEDGTLLSVPYVGERDVDPYSWTSQHFTGGRIVAFGFGPGIPNSYSVEFASQRYTYHSSDGGAAWDSTETGIITPLEEIRGGNLSAQTHFLVGYGGDPGARPILLRRRLDDSTWVRLNPDLPLDIALNDISNFNTSDTAFLCGSQGSIYKSTDDGDTWAAESTGVSSNLHAMAFVDEHTGFAVGDGGTILHLTSAPIVPITRIRVPLDERTIQAAIAFAHNGDTVLVDPGTYHEQIDFLGKDITVASLLLTTGDGKYISQTIIRPDSGSGVTFANGETASAILTGFTITGGSGTRTGIGSAGGGIFVSRASPTIRKNVIRDNFIVKTCGNRGGGIAIMDSSYPQIFSNTIRHNILEGPCECICQFGGGIWVDSSSNPVIGGSESGGNNIDSNGADIGQQIYRTGKGLVINAQYNYWGECPVGAGAAIPLDQFDLSRCLTDPILGVGEPGKRTVPGAFLLNQNYPNPFNPSTTIEYQVAKQVNVVVSIYDINGRLIRTLQHGMQPPGKYSLVWDGKSENGGTVSSGEYIYQVKSEGVQLVRKMLLLR